MAHLTLTTAAGLDERVTSRRKRMTRTFAKYDNYRLYCQMLAEFFWPERANFTEDRTPGVDMQEGLYTGTPQVMRRDFGNRVGTVLRPPKDEWFRAVARPEEMMGEDAVRYWCDIVSRQQRRIIYKQGSQFSRAMAIGDQDYVTFGNAVTWCSENRDNTGLLFRNVHLRDCAWVENEEGVVDEMYEKIKMPLDQVARLFGPDKLPREWKRRFDKDDGKLDEVIVARAVFPIVKEDYAGGRKPPTMMKFCVLYFAWDQMRSGESGALGESYCRVFPYNVRRWMPLGEPFGRSLCTSVALADARTLNVSEMATLKAIEMVGDPPKWAEDEAVIGEVDLVPGGVTFVDTTGMGPNSRAPLGVIEGGDPRYVMEFNNRKRADLAIQFFETLWKFPEREMTAFETGERLNMMVQDATPVFEPMEADNTQLMDIVFAKSSQHGAFPPPPDRLIEEGGAEWEFETPVTTGRRRALAYKAKDIIVAVGEARQSIPTFGDHLDTDELEREMIAGLGPENWVLPREVVAEKRGQRAQAEKQARMEEDMLETAKIGASARPENLKALEEALNQGES